MIDYDEATAIRRSTRLVMNSSGVNFSMLNVLVIILLVMLAVACVVAVFQGLT